jgi:hypothetical protein
MERQNAWVSVWVFNTEEEMYEGQKLLVRQGRSLPVRKDFAACFVDWQLTQPGTGKRVMGFLLCNKQNLQPGVISHECTHAALTWLRKSRYNHHRLWSRDNVSEALCTVQGNLYGQLTERLEKLKGTQ